MRQIKPLLTTISLMKRSVTTLLFALFVLLSASITNLVSANSLGTSGNFGGYSYQVQPGDSLIDTGTQFRLINNFPNAVQVEVYYEAPRGVSINTPSDPITISAGGNYTLPVEITTTEDTAEGTFQIRIVGRIIPQTVNGIELTGSAGLNAALTVQGEVILPPTLPPVLAEVSTTSTTAVIDVTNQDSEDERGQHSTYSNQYPK